jgi:hypothetical protein
MNWIFIRSSDDVGSNFEIHMLGCIMMTDVKRNSINLYACIKTKTKIHSHALAKTLERPLHCS